MWDVIAEAPGTVPQFIRPSILCPTTRFLRKYRITSYLFNSHLPVTRLLRADRIKQQTSIQSAFWGCHVRGRGSDEWDCELWHGDHRQDTIAFAITLDPGPVTDDSLATHSVQQVRGKGTHISKIMTQHNSLCRLKGVFANCSTHFLELINPGQRLPIKCSSNSVLVWYNLHVAGSATATVTTYPELPPLSSASLSLEVAHLFFWQLQHRQGYQQTCILPPLHVHPYTLD